MRRVVDTNVAIVANGRNTNAAIQCRLAAIDFLMALITNGKTILDFAGEIQDEYHRYLNPSGQPGVGDQFFQTILRSAPTSVERIDLQKDANGHFTDFPNDPALTNFDASDKKFVAAAVKSGATITNATDSDWVNFHGPLTANGLVVEFLCGRDPKAWIE